MNTISPINPATGLPMIGDTTAGVDVGGNPYGMNWNSHDGFGGNTSFDNGLDIFSSSTLDWSQSFSGLWD